MASRPPRGWLRWIVLAVGVHSCVLGVSMLLFPRTLSERLGFGATADPFFASQAGIFLLALGICYLLALRDRALVAVIVVSKALAVAFLVTHAAFLDGPPILWAAAAGDAAMLAATIAAWVADRASSPAPASRPA